MKRIVKVFVCLSLVACLLTPFGAYAKPKSNAQATTQATTQQPTAKQIIEAPVLKSISFNDGEIAGEFSSTTIEYNLVLSGNKTPTLKSYEISDGAEIFITKIHDEVSNEVGINVEVKRGGVSTNYSFKYDIRDDYVPNSNNALALFYCELGEVYPALNEKDRTYTLYIPKDLTVLRLSAIAQDVGAKCAVPDSITLKEHQNPKLEISVTASNGAVRVYTFQVKRLNKTTQEVEQLMNEDGFTSIVEDELFYKRDEFKLGIIGGVAGIIIVVALATVLKRKAIKAQDSEEVDFYVLLKPERAEEDDEDESAEE